ncbi:MAG TPA: MFS transporter [Kofleriaceae bacterium]|nr:MFS transporter [Kofleriaceae bacterium]
MQEVSARSPIGRLVAARSLNSFGRSIISSTVLWELFKRTDDPYVIAGVGIVQVLPVVLLFVPVGELVDRSDRRTLTTAAAMLAGGIGLGLAAASFFAVPVAVYFTLLLAFGCVTAVHAPASVSLIPLIIPRDDLVRTNRISSSLQEVATISGPALSGLALKLVDPHWVYSFVALTGIASGTLYRALPKPRATQQGPTAAAARKDWRTGLRFIFNSPLLLPALTLDMFAVLFAGVTALLPVVALKILHTDAFGYGLLRAAQSVGAVLMAVIGGRLSPWKRPGRVLLIVVALFGAATMAFGLSTSLPLSVGLLVVCGALDNISVVIRLTLEQMVVPDAIRGRVSSVHFVFIGMSNELGAAESGVAAGLLGTIPAIVVGGALAIGVVGVVTVKWRELAKMPPLHELKPADSA